MQAGHGLAGSKISIPVIVIAINISFPSQAQNAPLTLWTSK